MRPIQFRQHPALVSAGDALGLAFDHLLATLRIWVLPALAYSVIVGALIGSLFGNLLPELVAAGRDREAAARIAESMLARVPAFIGIGLLATIGGIALSWLLYAVAIGGLPGRRMTADAAISAGLRTLLAGLLYVVFAGLGMTILVLGGALLFQRVPWLPILAFLALIPVFVYLALRLAFTMFAIFDGAGPVEGYQVSWAISRGAVLRILGWSLLIGVFGFVINLGTSFLGGPMASAPAAGIIVSTFLTTIYQAFQITMMAILYESQRTRTAAVQPPAEAQGTMPMPTPVPPGLPGSPSPTTTPDPLQPPPPPPPRPW